MGHHRYLPSAKADLLLTSLMGINCIHVFSPSNTKLDTTSETEKIMSQQIKDLTDENMNLKEEHRKTDSKLKSTLLQVCIII